MRVTSRPISDVAEICPRKYGKGMITQWFQKGGDKPYDFVMWHSHARPVMVFPLTPEGKVVAIRQYREASEQTIIEIPGGNPKGNQSDEEVARIELLEETGMEPQRIVRLHPERIFWEPASLRCSYAVYLALGCNKVQELQLDDTESISVHQYPLRDWVFMILRGIVVDPKTVSATMLALSYLDVTFDIPDHFTRA